MAKTKKQGENSACSALIERAYYSSGYGIVKWCGWKLGSRSSANLLQFVTILDSRAFLLFVTILDSRPILLFVDDGLAKI